MECYDKLNSYVIVLMKIYLNLPDRWKKEQHLKK